jgi:hypothetical protein
LEKKIKKKQDFILHVKNGPLALWYGPLIFWMAHWNFEEGAMGPFSKNLSLSLYDK